MHKIFWDTEQVSMLTNAIAADQHKHWTLQLFLSMGQPLQLTVNGQHTHGRCILVENDQTHTFSTGNQIHYSMLIEVTSNLGRLLKKDYLKGSPYCDLSMYITERIEKELKAFIERPDIGHYQKFIEVLHGSLGIPENMNICFDERLQQIFHYFMEHDLQGVMVTQLADLVHLSPSRLAHLFKEQTGVPLKSYLVLQKIYRAFSMLFEGYNITEAAMMAGFDSPSHFASNIKAWMGTTPKLAVKDSEFLKVSNAFF